MRGRLKGLHGGGIRYQTVAADSPGLFNRASVNVSAVHYEDKPKYPVDSATALSVILHPTSPRAPSMHFHISYMEPRGRPPYWRMIADLNPSIVNHADIAEFEAAVRGVPGLSPALCGDAEAFGDAYFWIPALERHRGAYHLFIAKLEPEELDPSAALRLAEALATTAIDTYANIVSRATATHPPAAASAEDRARQLDYHTLYLYQVLTLDRGTTHGILAHDQNDVGLVCQRTSSEARRIQVEFQFAVAHFFEAFCPHDPRSPMCNPAPLRYLHTECIGGVTVLQDSRFTPKLRVARSTPRMGVAKPPSTEKAGGRDH